MNQDMKQAALDIPTPLDPRLIQTAPAAVARAPCSAHYPPRI